MTGLPLVVTVGTSIEAGTWLNPGASWPARLGHRLAGRAVVADRSLPGGAYTRANELGDTIRAHVDAALVELEPDVVVLAGPVNDLVSNYDTLPVRWALHAAALAVKAAGGRAVLCGVHPFTDGGAFAAGWWPGLEQRRQEVNGWARAAAANGTADAYIEPGRWLRETASERGDGRWFLDGLHPTELAAVVIAEAIPLEALGLPA